MEYSVFTKNNVAKIKFNRFKLCVDSLGHELNHILLKRMDVYAGSTFCLGVINSTTLNEHISQDLQAHISNILDHVKVLELYLEQGFTREKFIDDNWEEKCNNQYIDLIGFYKLNNEHFIKYFELYLGKYFAIKGCPNDFFDYRGYLDSLKGIDSKLFSILDNFWSSWVDFNIAQNDYADFRLHVFQFCDDLKSYLIYTRARPG